MMTAEFLIVGQGLAGTAVAWRLLERGRSFVVADRNEPVTSSKVAAGVVTPITGMRLTLNWRYHELHAEALRFYRAREQQLGGRFFFPRPHVRLLKNEREAGLWQRRRDEDAVRRYVNAFPRKPLVDDGRFENALGGFQQRHSGFLDTPAYLDASRAHFARQGAWIEDDVNEDEIELQDGMVEWRGRRFATVIFCQGWEACRSRWFSWLPFDSARGTILTLRGDFGDSRRGINRGCWLVPRGDGTVRAGSTYELRFDDPNVPAPGVVEELIASLRSLVRVPFEVIASQTAARPIVKHCQCVIGRHPAHSQLAVFNGLGSKGSLRAPFMARRLVEHLLDGAALDPEFDVQANR